MDALPAIESPRWQAWSAHVRKGQKAGLLRAIYKGIERGLWSKVRGTDIWNGRAYS